MAASYRWTSKIPSVGYTPRRSPVKRTGGRYRRKLHVIEGDMHRAEQLRERRACREEQLQADQVAWRKIEVAKEKRAQEIRDRKAEIRKWCLVRE
ncbi:hypothetical protein FOZ62_015831 [Perkinsus olseni]|uniref:Uncharacterized protein n=1 Tax=Perkinsus olseni TaxID=32597 RepID=A0A7J6NWA3_PEROL|nr:hypothetical protein FOZ62_015831 [Perkinsus olseni]